MKINKMEKTESQSELQDEELDFIDGSHTGHILNQLREMHKRGQFCDAKLIVGEHETDIHRAVLASASSYFFKMFEKCDEDDNNQASFKLKDIAWETFKPLLDYVYTGRLIAPEEEVKAVYRLSQDLRIHSATTACAQHLIKTLTPDNCLGIRTFATEESFQQQVSRYISDNIREVTNSKKFYGLKRISLEIVVPDEHLINIASNDEVVQEILVWIKNKFPDFKKKVEALSEDLIVLYLNLDGSLTDCNDVEDETVQDNELVQDYKKLTRKKQSGKVTPKEAAVIEASQAQTNYIKFNIEPYSPKQLEWSIVAAYKTKALSYMVIAMLNGHMVAMSVHYRPAVSNSSGTDDPESPVHSNGHAPSFVTALDLSPLKGMSTNRCAFGLKVLDGKLFACGGYDRGECLKSTELYDMELNTWNAVNDMKSARGRFSISMYENKIYAFGGSNGNHDMRTVECYDPETNQWTIMAESPRGKASPGIAMLHGHLYVLGGCIGQNTVATCEMLNLTTLQWQAIAPMRNQRYQVAVTVFKNKIFAIGGTNGWRCLNEVEVYDPTTNEWSHHSHLNIARRGAGVDVYQGKVYVVGGNDGQSALNSMEVYDPETHSWTLGATLGVPRANCGVAVLKDRLYAVGGFNGKKFLNSIEYYDFLGTEHWRSNLPLDSDLVFEESDLLNGEDIDDEILQITTTESQISGKANVNGNHGDVANGASNGKHTNGVVTDNGIGAAGHAAHNGANGGLSNGVSKKELSNGSSSKGHSNGDIIEISNGAENGTLKRLAAEKLISAGDTSSSSASQPSRHMFSKPTELYKSSLKHEVTANGDRNS